MEYIYFIENTKTSNFKIGKTNNIHKRIKALQTGNDQILTVKKYIVCDNVFKIEKIIHRYFSTKRVNGEWFGINMSQINEVCKVISLAKLLRSKNVKDFKDNNPFLLKYLKTNFENKITLLREILQISDTNEINKNETITNELTNKESYSSVDTELPIILTDIPISEMQKFEPCTVEEKVPKKSDQVSLVRDNIEEKRPAFVLQFDDRLCCNIL
jgi:hypothetical protein